MTQPTPEGRKLFPAFRRGFGYRVMVTVPIPGRPDFRRAVFGPTRPTRGWARRAAWKKAESA